MPVQPQKEHQWLQKLVGEWTYETEAMMEPDQLRQYGGELDTGETVLTLNSDGPSMTGDEKLGKYKDLKKLKRCEKIRLTIPFGIRHNRA